MSRTFLHKQYAKYKERLHLDDPLIYHPGQVFSYLHYDTYLPFSKSRGWHKLARLFCYQHERTAYDHTNTKSRYALTHKIMRSQYMKDECEYGFRPVKRPKFRRGKADRYSLW